MFLISPFKLNNLKPIFLVFSEINRNFEKFTCNKICKLLLESILFNVLFNYKGGPGKTGFNNPPNKGGKNTQNNRLSGITNYKNIYQNNNNLSLNKNILPKNPGKSDYTLVLDLDETMIHYFFVSF